MLPFYMKSLEFRLGKTVQINLIKSYLVIHCIIWDKMRSSEQHSLNASLKAVNSGCLQLFVTHKSIIPGHGVSQISLLFLFCCSYSNSFVVKIEKTFSSALRWNHFKLLDLSLCWNTFAPALLTTCFIVCLAAPLLVSPSVYCNNNPTDSFLPNVLNLTTKYCVRLTLYLNLDVLRDPQ